MNGEGGEATFTGSKAVDANKVQPDIPPGRGALFAPLYDSAVFDLLQEEIHRVLFVKATADLCGIDSRGLGRWGLMMRAHEFSCDKRRGA